MLHGEGASLLGVAFGAFCLVDVDNTSPLQLFYGCCGVPLHDVDLRVNGDNGYGRYPGPI